MSFFDRLWDDLDPTTPYPPKDNKILGVVEDIDDPENGGRVRVRLVNQQTTDKNNLATDKLAWFKTRPGIGASGGKGESVNWLVDQVVELVSTDDTGTDWQIVGGSSATTNKVNNESNDSFGGKAKGDDKRSHESVDSPALSTGDIKKLAVTAYSAIQAGMVILKGNPSAPDSPDVPAPQHNVVAVPLDWRNTRDKISTRYGLAVGNLYGVATVDGKPSNSKQVEITLIPESTGSPGFVDGVSTDGKGTPLILTYVNDDLVVPTLVNEGDYIIRVNIKYLLTSIPDLQTTVKIKVVDLSEDIPLTRYRALRGASDAITEINVKDVEYDPTQGKRSAYRNTKDNGGIIETKDYNQNNVCYRLAHNYGYDGTQEARNDGKQDPEKFSSMTLGAGGDVGIKSANDLVLVSRKNLMANIQNAVEIQVAEHFKLIAKEIQQKATDMRIEAQKFEIHGDTIYIKEGTKVKIETPTVEIIGDVTVTGSIVAQGEVTGKGIELSTHTHKQPHVKLKETKNEETAAPTP